MLDPAYAETLRVDGIAECGRLAATLRDRGADAVFVMVPSIAPDAAEKTSVDQVRAAVEPSGGQVRALPAAFAQAATDRETGAITREGHAALADEIVKILGETSPKVKGFLGGQAP